MKRGEVWSTKIGPCVVLSPPELLGSLPTVIVAPMSTHSIDVPFRVPVKFDGKDGLILIDQLRAVRARSVLRPFGRLDATTLSGSLDALIELFTA